MTRTFAFRIPAAARTLAAGAALAVALGLGLPGTAAAHGRDGRLGWQIAEVARDVDRLREIRSLYHRDAEIDRLQARLVRLEGFARREHGRHAREARARIDELQHRLAHMERRVERRLDARDRRWDRQPGYSRATGYGYGYGDGRGGAHRPRN